MGSQSKRLHIAWLPEKPSEPTSTIVLTSPQNRFVDLRIVEPAELDWAIAGTSASSPREDGNGNKFTHSSWSHWVSSRTKDAESVVDEGDMYPNADGTTLEKGTMENPATGKDTEYEELWLDTDPVGLPQSKTTCVVLKFDQGAEERGMVILLGRCCQGLLRSGDSITAERWNWDEHGSGWSCSHKIGEGVLPCSDLLKKIDQLQKTDSIVAGDRTWTVVELS